MGNGIASILPGLPWATITGKDHWKGGSMITGKEDSSGQHLHFPSLTGNIAAAGAVDREFGDILGLFFLFISGRKFAHEGREGF